MKKLRERLAVNLSLPKEIALNLPLITAVGKGDLTIENYKNLAEFSDTTIRIRTSCGLVTVTGEKLSLQQITSENLYITGRITGVLFE